MGSENDRASSVFHLCLNSHALIMPCKCLFSCDHCIWLVIRISRCGTLMASPVIQNFGNMADLLTVCMLRAAKQKIKVLRTVIFWSQKSCSVEKCSLYNHQMADIIYAAQIIRVKIRLKMREKPISSYINNILIRINKLRLRIL